MKTASFKSGLLFWRLIALGFLSLGLLPIIGSRPVQGAEKIALSYGIGRQVISVETLKSYANTGIVDKDLALYIRHATPEQQAQLRQILQSRIPFNSQNLSKLLDTSIGKSLIYRLSNLIYDPNQTRSHAAVRTALMRAVADSDGLTALNVLRQFPDNEIELDISHALSILATWKSLIAQTDQMITQVNQNATQEAMIPALANPLKQMDLKQKGRFTWKQHSLKLIDRSRNRTVFTDLYLPNSHQSSPVIVISHGLSSNRASFAYLAQHLTTYGFAVAVPEHPGSNWQQLLNLFNGKVDQITPPDEFIDRPRDISFLLDELSHLAQSNRDFQGRLKLEQVGVIGQSFGGYTALMLAGAKINFKELRTHCQTAKANLNLSLLLQCQALALPQQDYDLADSRVKAVMTISPIASSIFGKTRLSQIDLPVLMTASSHDILTPVLTEQFYPFTWLTTPDKYLALLNGTTHFSSIAPPRFDLHQDTDSPHSSDVTTRRYIAALSTAFFQTYVANRPSYRSYLSATYASAMSEDPFQLSLVQALTTSQPNLMSNQFFSNRPLVLMSIMAQVVGVFYFIRKYGRSENLTNQHSSIRQCGHLGGFDKKL